MRSGDDHCDQELAGEVRAKITAIKSWQMRSGEEKEKKKKEKKKKEKEKKEEKARI